VARVRVALDFLRVRLGSRRALAKAMRFKEKTLERAAKRPRRHPTTG